MCHNQPLVSDKPLGAPTSVKLTYYKMVPMGGGVKIPFFATKCGICDSKLSFLVIFIKSGVLISEWLFPIISGWAESILRWSGLTEIPFEWSVICAYGSATVQLCGVGAAWYLRTEKAHSNAPDMYLGSWPRRNRFTVGGLQHKHIFQPSIRRVHCYPKYWLWSKVNIIIDWLIIFIKSFLTQHNKIQHMIKYTVTVLVLAFSYNLRLSQVLLENPQWFDPRLSMCVIGTCTQYIAHRSSIRFSSVLWCY